jgi:hypothetical protein
MRSTLLVLALAAGLAACDDTDGVGPSTDPLQGLRSTSATDSAGNAAPTQPPQMAGPGYFRGVVRTSQLTAGGPDTLANSVRVANVQVTAYQRRPDGTAGTQVASTTTNDRGEFQLATMPGGEYIVTFVPPSGSAYQGVWVTAEAHPRSHEWPWWVTLPKK